MQKENANGGAFPSSSVMQMFWDKLADTESVGRTDSAAECRKTTAEEEGVTEDVIKRAPVKPQMMWILEQDEIDLYLYLWHFCKLD